MEIFFFFFVRQAEVISFPACNASPGVNDPSSERARLTETLKWVIITENIASGCSCQWQVPSMRSCVRSPRPLRCVQWQKRYRSSPGCSRTPLRIITLMKMIQRNLLTPGIGAERVTWGFLCILMMDVTAQMGHLWGTATSGRYRWWLFPSVDLQSDNTCAHLTTPSVFWKSFRVENVMEKRIICKTPNPFLWCEKKPVSAPTTTSKKMRNTRSQVNTSVMYILLSVFGLTVEYHSFQSGGSS